jgi:3-dehydroquinate dehydratase/shikimate dehydrogenase
LNHDRHPAAATLVATLTSPPSEDGRELAALPPQVEVLEVRSDLVGELPPAFCREHFPGRLLYTLRSRAEGGRFSSSAGDRRRRLCRAAQGFDWVDLEGERDLEPEVLAAVPAEQRLLSWHGPALAFGELEQRCERLTAVPARFYKLIPAAETSGEELAPLQLLAARGRVDVVAFAAGAPGVWTRVIAPRLGSPLVYGSAGGDPAAPGQPTVERLIRDFGLPRLPPVEKVFGIVGNPVAHSLSPRLHNGAYAVLGVPALYLPFHATTFGDFWLEVVESPVLEALGLELTGLSVTSPFKASALAVAGASSPLAEMIGGANTLVLHDGVWEAESTDPDGVVLPLERRGVRLEGRPAAVFGAGGAGRAAAVGLARKGARVTLVNRGLRRGREASAALELEFLPLEEADPGLYELLVNATPLGGDDADEPPFAPERLRPGAVVVDMVYRDRPTELVRRLRQRGHEVVDGREMLLHQAFAQLRLMTGRDLPPELGRRLLDLA